MNKIRTAHLGGRIATLALLATELWAQPTKPLYETDFSKAELEQVPTDMLVLDGQFAVKEESGNRFLELPGAPLETFGVLFGPSEKENFTVEARILGTSQGRRFPAFGLSAGGVSGYRLQVTPSKNQVELFKGDTVVAGVPFQWKSGQWTALRLQVRQTGDATWKIEGTAWKAGDPMPSGWLITFEAKEAPLAGRPGVWGKPFSGTPIRFDDLKVAPLNP